MPAFIAEHCYMYIFTLLLFITVDLVTVTEFGVVKNKPFIISIQLFSLVFSKKNGIMPMMDTKTNNL